MIKEEEFDHVSVKGVQYGMKIRDGIYLPNDVLNLSSVKDLKLCKDDIIVSTYPKSGKDVIFIL